MSARTDRDAPAGPLTSALRHPVVVALCLTLGLVLGVVAALLTPTTHQAEARVAIVPANTSAYTIAGYPIGARELAADYARWVQNRAADGNWTSEGLSDVGASPIPNSAVIRIEVDGDSEDNAVAGAQHVADTLLATVAEAREGQNPEAAYADFQSIAPQVAEARGEVAAAEQTYAQAVGSEASTAVQQEAQEALTQAQTALAEVQLRQDAAGDLYRRLYVDTAGNSTLEVVAPAASTGGGAGAAIARYGLLGLGAGGLAGLLAAIVLDRRRAAAKDGAAREDAARDTARESASA